MADIIPDDVLWPGDPLAPDDVHVIWPAPRDPKIDMALVVKYAFEKLGILDVPIVKEGAFKASLLSYIDANREQVYRPVVTISRAQDRTSQEFLGQMVGVFTGDAPGLVDPAGVVGDDRVAAIKGEYDEADIDLVISDTNSVRADQMYAICKIIMLAAKPEFLSNGYTLVKLVNGGDAPATEIDDPAPGMVFARTLTYKFIYPVFIASAEQLATIVLQSLTPNGASVALQTQIDADGSIAITAGAMIA